MWHNSFVRRKCWGQWNYIPLRGLEDRGRNGTIQILVPLSPKDTTKWRRRGTDPSFPREPFNESLLRVRNVVVWTRERERKRERERERERGQRETEREGERERKEKRERNIKYVHSPCDKLLRRDYSLCTYLLHIKRHEATCAILNHVRSDCCDRRFYFRINPISSCKHYAQLSSVCPGSHREIERRDAKRVTRIR